MCSWKTRSRAGAASGPSCSGGVGAASASAPRAGWGQACAGRAGRALSLPVGACWAPQAVGPALFYLLAEWLVGSQFPEQGLNLGPGSRTVGNPLACQGTAPAFPCFFGNLMSSFSFCREWRVKIKIE